MPQLRVPHGWTRLGRTAGAAGCVAGVGLHLSMSSGACQLDLAGS